jgi:microtubule-associated protein-like 1/2
MRSHYDKEVCGIAPHPSKTEVISAGREGILAIWDTATRRQTRYAKLECGADAVAFSNVKTHDYQHKDVENQPGRAEKCHMLAVGMRNGYLLVVYADKQLSPVAKTQHCKDGKAITVIKFSPDDRWCAVGGEDGVIKLYDVFQKFKKCHVIRKSKTAITHLDFSKCGSYLMANNKARELLYFDTERKGKHIKEVDLDKLTNALGYNKFHTWTCKYSSPTQGILPANGNGSDINIVCASPDEQNVVTGDDYGRVNMYRWPCTQPDALYSTYLGHSSKVTNMTFAKKDTKDRSYALLTTGGSDLCVFQWKYSCND